MEIWKVIEENTKYEVSNLGNVRHIKNKKILAGFHDPRGYKSVALSTNKMKRLIHRLVLHAFIGPCPEGKEVNHLNCIRNDNRLENLEYVTRSENIRYAIKLGRFIPPGVRKKLERQLQCQ